MQADAIVIGSGLFGSIITNKLRSEGKNVLMVDSREKGAGSRPAACLIKPSWVSSLGDDVILPAMDILEESYGVESLRFKVGPTHTTVFWVNPTKILSEEYIEDTVNGVRPDGTVSIGIQGKTLKAPLVVVAAGVWCNKLLPSSAQVKGLTGRAGVAYTWKGQLAEPFISPWAPYRQLVAFNRGPDEIWVGDGSAMDPEKWTVEKEQKILERCQKAVGINEPFQRRLFGIRPYVPKEKPCYLEQPFPGVWVATGGAKNGTLAAAWCAHKIWEAVK